MIKKRNTRVAVRTAHSFSSPLIISDVVLVALLSLLSGLVLDHKGATGVVKERMDMMAEIGENMNQIKAMVQLKIPFAVE